MGALRERYIMTKHIQFRLCGAGIVIALLQSFPMFCQSDITVVNRPRPLARAAEEVEHKYGVLINYEDPPYTFKDDVVDLAASGALSQGRATQHVLIPKPGSLTASMGMAPTLVRVQANEAASLVSSLLSAYHASGNSGRFTFVQNGDVVTILPSRSNDRNGASQSVVPVLNTPITIPEQHTTVLNAVQLMCAAINNNSGAPTVDLGTVPTNILVQRTIDLSASNEPSRGVLERILATAGQGDPQTRRRLVWQLLYGPDVKKYVLNIHIAARERLEPTGKGKKMIPIQ